MTVLSVQLSLAIVLVFSDVVDLLDCFAVVDNENIERCYFVYSLLTCSVFCFWQSIVPLSSYKHVLAHTSNNYRATWYILTYNIIIRLVIEHSHQVAYVCLKIEGTVIHKCNRIGQRRPGVTE